MKNVSRDPQDIQNMMKTEIVQFTMIKHEFSRNRRCFKRYLRRLDFDSGADCGVKTETQPDVQLRRWQ